MKGFVLYGMVGAKDPLPLTLTMETVNVEMRYRIDQQHRIGHLHSCQKKVVQASLAMTLRGRNA